MFIDVWFSSIVGDPDTQEGRRGAVGSSCDSVSGSLQFEPNQKFPLFP